MKNKKTTIGLLLITLIACFTVAIVGFTTSTVKAAVIEKKVFSDDFDYERNYESEDWILKGANIVGENTDENKNKVMRLTNDSVEWTGHIVYSDYLIANSCTIEITFKPIRNDVSSYLALSFGVGNYNYGIPYSSAALFMYGNNIGRADEECMADLFVQKDLIGSLQDEDSRRYDIDLFSSSYTGERKLIVDLTLVDPVNHLYDIEVTVMKVGDMADADESKNIFKRNDVRYEDASFKNVYIDEGYIGFNSSKCDLDIYEFAVKEDGVVVRYDDFSESELQLSTNSCSNPTWYGSPFWTEDRVVLGKVGKLELPIGSKAIYVNEFIPSENKDIDRVLSLSANFTVNTMDIGGRIGYLLFSDENGNDGIFAGIKRSAVSTYELFLSKGDEVNQATISGSVINQKLILEVYNNGEIKLILGSNTLSVTFKVINLQGYIGFECSGDGLAKGGYVDNFTFSRASYVKRVNDDVSTHFNDVVEEEMFGDVSYDFYISPDWISNWTTPAKYVFVTPNEDGFRDGYMGFYDASIVSGFGPKKQYTDFIAKFDITMVDDNIPIGAQFGLNLGMDSASQNAASAGVTYISFFVNGVYEELKEKPSDWETSYTNYYIVSATGAHNVPEDIKAPIFIKGTYFRLRKFLQMSSSLVNGLTSVSYENINDPATGNMPEFFSVGDSSNPNVYNIMFICENGTVSVYYKLESEDESVMSKPKYVCHDVDTDGYLSFFATALSLRLDNFSVINIDHHYFTDTYLGGENLENIRYDFATGTNFRALKNANVSNGVLPISNSSIETQGKVGANITRLYVKSATKDIVYDHGDLKIIFDAINKKIKLTCNGQNIEKLLSERFVFEDSVFEIKEEYNKVIINYLSGDGNLLKLYDNKFEFNVDLVVKNSQRTPIKLSSSGALRLSKLSIFNIDSNDSIVDHPYVEVNNRPVKKSIQEVYNLPYENGDTQEDSKGCSLNIYESFYVAPIVIAVAILFVLIKKKKEAK